MIIKKININDFTEIRISKDVINGTAFIQIKIWEKIDNQFKPTNKPIVLKDRALMELIGGLKLSKYLESNINGLA